MKRDNTQGTVPAAKALRESERKYKTLLKNIPQKIFYKDLNSVYVLCNESYADDLNIKPEEIVGRTDYDFYPKKLAEKYRGDDKRIMRSGKPEELEEKYIKAGRELAVHTLKAPVKDEKGSTIGIFGIFWNITKRRKMEEKLRVSEKRYRTMFENSPISLWEEDLSEVKAHIDNLRARGVKNFREHFRHHPEDVAHCATMVKVVDVNRATLELYKAKSRKEFWGGLSRIFCKESYDAFRELLTAMAEQKTVFECECFNKTLRDNKLHINLRYSLAPGFEDSWAKVLISIVDTTELRHAEKKMRLLNKELIESNKKLAQLVVKDPLTALYNHRYLTEIIEVEFYRAKRYAYPLSVTMLDIDYFNSINEVYGHRFGDLVLKQMARQLQKMMRRHDIVIRFGGEEFVVISPRTDISDTLRLAQRALDGITVQNFGDKKNSVRLKLSIGVSSYPENAATKALDLIATAERLLNKAKEQGGNRVCSLVDAKEKKPKSVEGIKDGVDTKVLTRKIETLNRRAKEGLIEAIFAFAKTIELKDPYTGDHVERTVRYATAIAQELHLSKDEIERIRKAAILHDLGKIGISEKILHKPAKLTKKELKEIEKHPQIGIDIIRPIKYLHDVIPLILGHHERWDGKGYPNGLKAKEIPIGARIIAIADTYQALTSRRPYRRAYTKKGAVKIIKKAAGTKYDPYIVSIFLKILNKHAQF